MNELLLITLLFALGLAVLVADIFLPSHFLLTALGLGVLGVAVYRVFIHYGSGAGLTSILACLMLWPAMVYIGVKHWHKTPAGRWLSPPNPTLTPEHIGVEVESLVPLIGAKGQAVTPLRPVGICRFGEQRVTCIAETGSVEEHAPVVGLAVRTGQLVVRRIDQT